MKNEYCALCCTAHFIVALENKCSGIIWSKQQMQRPHEYWQSLIFLYENTNKLIDIYIFNTKFLCLIETCIEENVNLFKP